MGFMHPLISPKLFDFVVARFVPRVESIHGPEHWRRVERNGLFLAAHSGADVAVVSYFALFHDSCRRNDGWDRKHGPRAAVFAREVHAEGRVELDAQQLDLLCEACAGHTAIRHSDDVTIGTCWDADRLDLTRLHMRPKAKYLNTEKACAMADTRDFSELEGYVFQPQGSP